MLRRLLLTTPLLLLLVACGTVATPKPTPTIASTPTATPTPAPTPTPTPLVTPVPQPTADPEKTQQLVFLDRQISDKYVSAWVVLEVTNRGDGWAQLLASQSTYTIFGPDDTVTGTGSFLYAFPEFIPPKSRAYLITEHVEDGVKPEQFARVEIDGRFNLVDDPGPLLSFARTAYRPDSFSGALVATGTVANVSSKAISEAAIGAIYFAANGKVLGVTYTNLVQNLDAGQTKGFETVSGSPVDPAAVDHFEVYGSDTGF